MCSYNRKKERSKAEESGEDDFTFNSDFSKLLTMSFAYLVLHIIH